MYRTFVYVPFYKANSYRRKCIHNENKRNNFTQKVKKQYIGIISITTHVLLQ